ncbi:AMP-binding protein [Nocardioides sp. AX2bis]|uniref:AMP-binding protein n=1 Tax=Nocardioides sp. AX2bis TaxID=2653157 RepID=UPI0012F338CE|nr:AMP-binding protein [Nocardioides sp. AX2bis]VXC56080.1 Long-chain-fatty-acid--CoA ligase [Nocardioides sp. AX2bis]
MERRPTGVPLASVADLSRFGDRLALVTGTGLDAGDEQVTYAELADRVADVGRRLGPVRQLVLVAIGRDVASVVAYLGALAAGHVVLLTQEAPGTVERLVETYDPDVVVRRGGLQVVREGSTHDLHPDLALLLSTSGTTGAPRLVRLGAGGVQANAEAIAGYLSVRDTDVAVTTLPLHYCYGLSVLHSHLLRGAAVVLTTLSVVDPCFWELVGRRGVTSLSGVPHTFDLLDRVGLDSRPLPSLRYLTQAGGRMAPHLVRRWAEVGQRQGFDLFVMYGQTEATARMAYLPPDLAREHPGAVGVPVPGGTLRVDDPDPTTGVGELVYAGPNVMLGYASSRADLARPREVTELRTGDLARRDPAGLVEVVGRTSRFAKLYGVRVDLDSVEHLLGDDGLTAACASDDDRLVVAVVDRDRLDQRGLVERTRARVLAATSLPPLAVVVVLVADLPRLPSGKPDTRAVLALAGGTHTGTDVRGTFALVLGRDRVADSDTFTSLGGDSLSYVEMSVRLEELLGDLPARWHECTVGDLEAGRRPARPRRRGRTLETGVLVRAVAIVAVVATHGNLVSLTGGAHVLLGVIGFNVARFHLTGAPAAERCRRLVRSALRVAVPTVVWAGAVTVLTDAYPWRTVLLLNGVAGPRGWAEPAWHLWFAEAAVLTLAGLAVLVALPAADRAERRWPFWFPVALAVAALSTRYGLVELRGGDDIHRAHVVFWLVALGWAAARATSWWHRAVVTVLLGLTVPGFFADPGREAVVVLGLLALVWVPTVRLPTPVARLVGTTAAASLWIYLTHWQVYPHLEDRWPWAAVLASLVVGVVAWRAWSAGWSAARSATGRPWSWHPVPQRRASGGGPASAVSPDSSTGRDPGTTPTATVVPGS